MNVIQLYDWSGFRLRSQQASGHHGLDLINIYLRLHLRFDLLLIWWNPVAQTLVCEAFNLNQRLKSGRT